MAPLALALALLAAVLHATWNFFLKGSDDRQVTAALMVALGGIIYLPWLFVDGLPQGVWDRVLVSAVVQALYFTTLVAAYNRVDFSVAYPIARGIAPALVTLGGWLLLGDEIAPQAGVAVAGIVVVLLWLSWSPGAMAGGVWALATGALIAVYTLNDAAAVRQAGHALSYTVTITVATAALLVPIVVYRRGVGQVVGSLRARPATLAGVAVLNIGAYGLVLYAATLAPVGLVAAVRESSVVIGAIAGVVLLGEPHAGRRIFGAAAVAVGIVALGVP